MAYFFVGEILKKCGIILVDIFNFSIAKSGEYFILKSIGNIVKKFIDFISGNWSLVMENIENKNWKKKGKLCQIYLKKK
jgi:hypothetical protein